MMKTKLLSMLLLTTFILSIAMVSANLDFVDESGVILNELTTTADQGTQATLSFYLQEGGHDDMANIIIISPMTLTSTTAFDAALTITGAPLTLDLDVKSGIVTVTFNILESQAIGTYIGELEVEGEYSGTSTSTIDVSVTITQPPLPEEILSCRVLPNPNDDLQIEIENINVISGFGEDEEWLPMDEIEIEIKVENDNSDEKIEDIVIGWGLYDEDTETWYIDEEESDFNLKKKDDKTIVVNFKLDDDIEDLEDYDKFYVWANALADYELNEADKNICAYVSEDIFIQSESDFVILDDIRIVESVECDMDLQISADVWNIGSDDQEDVYVRINEPDLGIDMMVEIGDIDAFDNEKLDITIQIPEDAEETTYFLKLKVYDEDDELYENDFDEDESVFQVILKVEGNCKVAPKATVTATLDSDAKSGKQLTIKSVITNDGSEQQTYTLEAADYTTWASLSDINPKVIVLEAGETAEVIYKLNVNKDVEGAQTFNIVVKTGDTEKETMKQPVSVTIEKSQGVSFPWTGSAVGSGDNWYLWGIGLLNVILIIIIIIVAIRVAKS